MSSMEDDKKLVELALGGEERAFEMIIRRYQNPILNYISRTIGDRELALDFTQDVFIKTYTNLHTYRPQFKFSTWLFKIASNTLIDFWRKKKIEAFSIDRSADEDDKPGFQVPDEDPGVSTRYELAQIRERIENILEEIPAPLRELFVLRHVNEFSYEEMAEIKGLPVGTIKNRVFQAKERIRTQLESEE